MQRCPVCGAEHTACPGLVSMPRPVDLPPKGEIKMSGERKVYRDERGNTFKATAEYAELHGWTLAEPEPATKARTASANKARTVRNRSVAQGEPLEAGTAETTGEALSDQDRATIAASSAGLQLGQVDNK